MYATVLSNPVCNDEHCLINRTTWSPTKALLTTAAWCAQVLWVDLLTKQEFEAGFGSHTPIFSGQTKCVRYYMNFERALAVFKEVLLRDGRGFDAHNIAGAPPAGCLSARLH